MTSNSSSQETAETALTTVDPRTINDLMDADPTTLTLDDKRQLIAELRKGRKIWAEEDRSSKTQGRRAKTSKGITPKKQLETESLAAELGIDLDSPVKEAK